MTVKSPDAARGQRPHSPFVLSFQELEQEEDFRHEKAIFIQERGRLLEWHLHHVDQPVGLAERGERVAAQTSLFQSLAIDAPDDRRVALHPHVPGNIRGDFRMAADEAIVADRHELMNGHILRDGHVGLDADMAAEQRSNSHRDPVAELAVVGDMRANQELIVAADAGDTVLLLGGAMNRHALADDIVVADLHACRFAPVSEVLRRPPMATNGPTVLNSPSFTTPIRQT